MISQEFVPSLAEQSPRIAELLPTLQAMARRYAYGSGVRADELEADMLYAIVERAASEPEFLEQNDSYILHYARYTPWAHINKAKVAAKYEAYSVDDSAVDDSLSTAWEPTDDLIRAEEALALAKAIEKLSKRENQVISLVVAGAGTGEIARIMGVSSPAVCSYKNRAVKKLRAEVAKM